MKVASDMTHMNSVDSDPFRGVLHWHRFDQAWTDEYLTEQLAAVGVTPVMIDREQQVVWVDKDNSFTPEIQKVLNNWSPQ